MPIWGNCAQSTKQNTMNYKITIVAIAMLMLLAMNEATSFMSYGFGDSTGAPIPSGTYTYLSTYAGCQVTGCHAGNPVNADGGSLVLSTNIPNTGWEAGTTYDITVNMSYPGKDIFGFKITSWGDVDSLSVGSFSLTDTSLQLQTSGVLNFNNEQVGELSYVTHTRAPEALIAPNIGSKSWTFKWTAPETQDQNVIFYAAGNAANGNGQTNGDHIYYKTLNIGNGGAITTGIDKEIATIDANIYPNPVNDRVSIELPDTIEGSVTIEVTDLSGKLALLHTYNYPLSNGKLSLDVSELAAGMHLIKINADNAHGTFKLMKL